MPDRFELHTTCLAGVVGIHPQKREDSRGSFTRLFCEQDLRELGFGASIAQINTSSTLVKGSIRGLHFQRPPHAEAKIVICMRGCVFDVAVDVRKGSATFLKWHGETLNGDQLNALYIPPGCAHGFQALSDDCQLLYLHSTPYHPASEGVIHAFEPQVNIAWPLEPRAMSQRDQATAPLGAHFQGLSMS
ncbi:MAG: dTDP-4-dehydrorhamnose 3,5-epimerase family protein [Chromatiales bacterium]|nr:dTDP-4-dehydrorhamnose 3,5-epimerase family protein [Chromatiales bacterium]